MAEICEIVEQKYLKGNTAILTGSGRYKLFSNETNLRRPSTNLFKSIENYGKVSVYVGYNCETLSGSTISLKMEGFDFDFGPDSFLACVGYPRVIDETILIEQSFEAKLWHKITSLLNENREETALVYLYETLHDELRNVSNCDSFLKISIGINMTSDIIVHILNCLSPIKSKLKYWEEFKVYATSLLEKEVGEQTSKILLHAIV